MCSMFILQHILQRTDPQVCFTMYVQPLKANVHTFCCKLWLIFVVFIFRFLGELGKTFRFSFGDETVCFENGKSPDDPKFTNQFSSSPYLLLIMRLIFFSPSVGFIIEVLLHFTITQNIEKPSFFAEILLEKFFFSFALKNQDSVYLIGS